MRRYIFILGFIFNIIFPENLSNLIKDKDILAKQNEEVEYHNFNSEILEETIDPSIYLVGPGDQFVFNMLSADGMVNLNLVVTPTGEILIPAVGKVNVDGKSLNQTITTITEQCHLRYSNATVHVALTKIRKFRILIKGPIDNPGYKIVSPLMRISDIYNTVNYANNNNTNDEKLVSIRNITLWRQELPIYVDLVKFYIFGDKALNPQLKQGDIVEFGLQENYIGIYGGVKISGKYELVTGESLFDIIQISGGFTKNADVNRIEITRFINDIDKINLEINSIEEAYKFILQDEDHINIRIKNDYKRQDLVKVTGEVNYPGTYSIEPNVTTIGELISRCGGLSSKGDVSKILINNMAISRLPDIELERITLIPEEYRSEEEKAYIKARARTPKGIMSSSDMKFTNEILSFTLNRNDEVFIPEILEYIEILGAVIHPGRYPFYRNYSVDSYLKLAGGLTETATRDKYLVKHSTGQRIPLNNKLLIENGDVLFIAERVEYSKWDRFKEIMAVSGQAAALIVVIQNALGP